MDLNNELKIKNFSINLILSKWYEDATYRFENQNLLHSRRLDLLKVIRHLRGNGLISKEDRNNFLLSIGFNQNQIDEFFKLNSSFTEEQLNKIIK